MRDDKLFFRVRQQMYALRINQGDIAEAIGKSPSYVSVRMCGKAQFDLADIYSIMDVLQIAPENMAEFFPRDGLKGV